MCGCHESNFAEIYQAGSQLVMDAADPDPRSRAKFLVPNERIDRFAAEARKMPSRRFRRRNDSRVVHLRC